MNTRSEAAPFGGCHFVQRLHQRRREGAQEPRGAGALECRGAGWGIGVLMWVYLLKIVIFHGYVK